MSSSTNLEYFYKVYMEANEKRNKKLSLEFLHARLFEFLELAYSYAFIFKSLYIEEDIVILSLNLSAKDSTRLISPQQKLGITVCLRRKFNDMNCEYTILRNLVIVKIFRTGGIETKTHKKRKIFSSNQ